VPAEAPSVGRTAGLAAPALAALAFGLDALGVTTDAPVLWHAGYLAAWGGAALAALRLPGHALGWRRQHRPAPAALLNAAAAALLALAAWVRGDIGVPPDPPVLGAEALCAALLLSAGRLARPAARPMAGRR
jgi:hypothetical protein